MLTRKLRLDPNHPDQDLRPILEKGRHFAWSVEEEKTLSELLAKDLDVETIAEIMKRKASSIFVKRVKIFTRVRKSGDN